MGTGLPEYLTQQEVDEEFGHLVGACYEPSGRPPHVPTVRLTGAAAPRYPGAFWLPTGQNLGYNSGPKSFAWHTAITDADSIRGWVQTSDACQGWVGRRGSAEQYKGFDEACYGTLDGNYTGVVTIESWDGLPVATATETDVNRDPWPVPMCERIADWIAWARPSLGIPIQRLHRTDSRGHGPHRTGISHPTTTLSNGNVYEGSGRWSSSTSKPCCGDKRLVQLYGPNMDGGPGSILSRAQAIDDAVSAGRCGWLPTGDVDLPAALARTGGEPVDWFTDCFA